MALVTSTSSLGGLAGSNALARLLVVISGDSSSLERSLGRASGSVSAFGKNAAALSNSLIRGVTLPILGLGGAALAVASQFESAMARVAGLTPILDTTGKSIEQISDELLVMAQEVPTGPVELANALYFAGSAGLDAATAMKVVELSAKGAAIGMGDAADISKVLIFALNNYQGAGLTAEKAMDSLTVAIKEGTAEPDQMAIALGRLLPVAREAGVTFEEVVGSVAQLTNVGFPARVATTSLRALFAELLAPTEQATDRLNQLGLTSEELRNTLMYGGPIAAFEAIQKAVKGDDDALRDILPQIRGFAGYLALVRDEGVRMTDIFEKTTGAVGDLDRAFEIIEKTPGFQFQIAVNKMKVAGIDMGRKLFPVFIKFSHILGDFADSIANLPDWVQKLIVDFGLLAAAVGPVLKLLTSMGAFTGGLISGFKEVATTLTAVGIAAVVAFAGFQSLTRGGASLFTIMTTIVSTTIALFGAMRLLQGVMNAGVLGVNSLTLAFTGLSTGQIGLIATALAGIGVAIAYVVGQSKTMAKSTIEMTGAMRDAAIAGETLRSTLDRIKGGPVSEYITQVAEAMKLLDVPAGEAFPNILERTGDNIGHVIFHLDALISKQNESGRVTDEQVRKWNLWRLATINATKSGKSLRGVFEDWDLDFGEFQSFLKFLENMGNIGGFESLRQWSNELLTATNAYGALLRADKQYQDSQYLTITGTLAEEKALGRYASRLGVTTDYLSDRLDYFGVSALGMGKDVKAAFETAITGAGKVSPAMAEMEAMVAETVENINSDLANFMTFEKVDANIKKTTDKILGRFQTNADMMLEEVANIQDLAARGVPGDVLGFLASQGPGFVRKFADASDNELRRLVTIYETQLGAMDDEILQESLHQERKGKNMVQAFTTGILSSSHLPPQVARNIVAEMTRAFAAGEVTEAGLKLALDFTKGVGHVKNLTKKEAQAAIQWFVEEIQKRNLTQVGRATARELARGLSSETGISRKAARSLVSSVVEEAKNKSKEITPGAAQLQAHEYARGLEDGKDKAEGAGSKLASGGVSGMKTQKGPAFTTGFNVGGSFAGGLRSQTDEAYNAGYAVGRAGKKGMDDGSKGSPRYFSYYLGQDIVKDFSEGLKNGRISKFITPEFMFPVSGNQGRLNDGGKPREKTNVDLSLDVTIDRSKTARALDWEYDVRGT